MEEKFGLKAETWIISILKSNGFSVIKSSDTEDHIFKVDFWVSYNNSWIPIQFSLDKKAIVGGKGTDALQRGVLPMWIDGEELEIAYSNGNGTRLVKEFLSRVKRLLTTFPTLKRFSTPRWTRTQQIK